MVPTAAGAIRRGVLDVQCASDDRAIVRSYAAISWNRTGRYGQPSLHRQACWRSFMWSLRRVSLAACSASLKPTKRLVDPFLRFIMVDAEHAVVRLPEALFIREQHPLDVLYGGEVLLRPV